MSYSISKYLIYGYDIQNDDRIDRGEMAEDDEMDNLMCGGALPYRILDDYMCGDFLIFGLQVVYFNSDEDGAHETSMPPLDRITIHNKFVEVFGFEPKTECKLYRVTQWV